MRAYTRARARIQYLSIPILATSVYYLWSELCPELCPNCVPPREQVCPRFRKVCPELSHWEEVTMKPTFETPNTLMLALWVVEGKAQCTAVLRADSNDVAALPVDVWGEPWATLCAALERTSDLGAVHCLVVTNWQPALDTLTVLHLDESAGDAHWQVVATLATRYAGRCTAAFAETLPRTEELWKRHWTTA